MRAGTKWKAGGAVLLSCAAVAGGMLVTSQAMAADPAPPTGTVTIVSMTAGDDEAVTCTYDDVALPAPPAGMPQPADGPTLVTSGSQQAGDPGPTLTGPGPEAGTGAGVILSASAAAGNEPGAAPKTVTFDGTTGGRQGTPDECAAMRETLPTP